MTDKPIIFSAPMITALLAGTKTQTRRLLKPPYGTLEWLGNDQWRPICTKIFPGDRLWVRECWRTASAYDDLSPSQMGGEEPIRYEADQAWQTWGWGRPHSTGRHRAARHMPRWASRLMLIVTDVRVQRLAEISEEDARAEGCRASPWPGPWWHGYREIDGDLLHQQVISDSPPDWMIEPKRMRHLSHLDRTAIDAFRSLWNTIHGPGAWEANPWVAAITFDVQHCNIDAAGA